MIQKPALAAGLSPGGVLAIWLAAYAPEDVLAIISEDPPIFSCIWPRIQDEKSMTNNFRVAADTLGKPGKRDVEGHLSQVGVPVEGKAELLKIPPFILKAMFFLARVNRAVRPNSPYDTPLLPFNMRAGYKFLSEHDSDIPRATIEGDLSKDFSPEEALKRIECPMLLLRVEAYGHETWGLVGAIDDEDLERIVSLVDDLPCVQISGGHEIHMLQPQRYIEEIIKFVDHLRDENKLP